jgi:hypothetical protein
VDVEGFTESLERKKALWTRTMMIINARAKVMNVSPNGGGIVAGTRRNNRSAATVWSVSGMRAVFVIPAKTSNTDLGHYLLVKDFGWVRI